MLDCHKLPAYFSHHAITSWSLDPLGAKLINDNTLRGRWLESRRNAKIRKGHSIKVHASRMSLANNYLVTTLCSYKILSLYTPSRENAIYFNVGFHW